MIVRGLLTTIPDSLPVPDDTLGTLRLLSDDTQFATVQTANGWYSYQQNGNPGPFRIVWDYDGVIKNQYSKIVGPSGPTDVGNIPLLFRTLNDGVIEGVGSNLAISANGTGMTVNVALGAAQVKGILYDHIVAGSVAVEAANTQARIDTVVIQVVPPGAGENIEGRSQIVVRKGTPASSPVAPTLVQTNALWEHPLVDIAVGANVLVIASNKITDRRVFASAYIPTASIDGSKIADDAITTGKIADGEVTEEKLSRSYMKSVRSFGGGVLQDPATVLRLGAELGLTVDYQSVAGQALIQINDGGIGTAKIANNAITADKIATNAVGADEIAAGAVGTAQIAANAITADKIGTSVIGADEIATAAVGTSELANGAVTAAKIATGAVGTSQVADAAITAEKLAPGAIPDADTLNSCWMGLNRQAIPSSGSFSGGTRTLSTLALGTLEGGVLYKVAVYGGINAKNDGDNGTFVMRASINGGATTEQNHPTVGGVPKWCPVSAVQEVTPSADGTIPVVISAAYSSGDAQNLMDGFVFAIAVPKNLFTE